jgi:hypothetical protein
MHQRHSRMQREARTIEAMIRIYCQAHHAAQPSTDKSPFCTSCADLLAYAQLRLAKCPYQEAKPTCAKCLIHCYGTKRREEIRTVMRYAGPRMMLRHPLLAVHHLLDGVRKPAPVAASGPGATKRGNRR